MSKYQFYFILNKIGKKIQNQNTTFRETISAKLKFLQIASLWILLLSFLFAMVYSSCQWRDAQLKGHPF